MSNYRRFALIFLIVLLTPIRCNACKETELLMDSFLEHCTKDFEYNDIKRIRNKYEFIGTFEITAYCPCSYCCGKSDGQTSSGVIATANHTIAADLGQFSYGDEVFIDGNMYVVEDSGGAIRGNRIDMFFNSHGEALSYGRRWEKLYTEYKEEYTMKEVPFCEWMMITIDLGKDKAVTTINNEDNSVEWFNQAGDILAYRNKKVTGEFSNYVDEGVYTEWKKTRR